MKKTVVVLIALLMLLTGCASEVSATEEVTENRYIFETGLDGTQEGWQCTKIHDGLYSETCVEWK